jgi:hypothetical protein
MVPSLLHPHSWFQPGAHTEGDRARAPCRGAPAAPAQGLRRRGLGARAARGARGWLPSPRPTGRTREEALAAYATEVSRALPQQRYIVETCNDDYDDDGNLIARGEVRRQRSLLTPKD